MLILFCSNPLSVREVDIDYQEEYIAAISCGLFEVGLIDFDALVNEKDAEKAVRRVLTDESEKTAIYRGWMMTLEQYKELYGALLNKNIKLINTPDSMRIPITCLSGTILLRSILPKAFAYLLKISV